VQPHICVPAAGHLLGISLSRLLCSTAVHVSIVIPAGSLPQRLQRQGKNPLVALPLVSMRRALVSLSLLGLAECCFQIG
jgi:hypothetical protein